MPSAPSSTPSQRLQAAHKRINSLLEIRLPEATQPPPTDLHCAMRYSVLQSGKRLRPLLVYSIGDFLDITPTSLDPIACAIELIHIYSLVHDDLPAMDNDTLRRGQPTCHVVFDEATAILVGDALQSLAFSCLAAPHKTLSPGCQLTLIQKLSEAIGSRGMVGGQSLEWQYQNDPSQQLSGDTLTTIHRLKTAKLFEVSVQMPITLHTEPLDDRIHSLLNQLGSTLGLMFQIQDDHLDQNEDTTPNWVQQQGETQTLKQYFMLKNELKMLLQTLQVTRPDQNLGMLSELIDSMFTIRSELTSPTEDF